MDAYSVLKLAGSLALVVAMIYLAAWLIRKFDRHLPHSANTIKILDTRSVDPRHSVIVVDVSGVRLILGVTPQSMSLLQVLPQPRAHVDSMTADPCVGSGNKKSFNSHVKHALEQP